MSAPLSSSWRTPAIPSRASIRRELRERAFEQLRVRVEEQQPGRVAGRRGQVAAWAKPRFSLAIARACGKSRSTRSRAAPVAPLSTTTRSSEPCASRSASRDSAAASAPGRGDDDDGEVVHGRTVASHRGRVRRYLDERQTAKTRGLERGPAARLLRRVSSFEPRQTAKVRATAARARRAPQRPAARPDEAAAAPPGLRRARAPGLGERRSHRDGPRPALGFDRRLPFLDGSARRSSSSTCSSTSRSRPSCDARRDSPPARAGRDLPRRRARLRPLPRELCRRPRLPRGAPRAAEAACSRSRRSRLPRPPLRLGRRDARARAGRVRARRR